MSTTAVPFRPLRKGAVALLWTGLGLLALAAVALAWFGTRTQVLLADPQAFLERNAGRDGVQTTRSGLQYRVLQEGRGPTATPVDLALIKYEGRLLDGTVFDQTPEGERGTPMPVGGMIPGFSEALQLMRQGSKLELWIPPRLAYGSEGTPGGPIPPDAVLNFDLEMVALVPGGAMQGMFGAPPGGVPGQ